jgi:mannose-6-phosphate isomerase
MERVWGGRRLEQLFGKPLPPGAVIGESWELVDREEAQSVVRAGELAGMSLHELWSEHRDGLFGARAGAMAARAKRFPLLVKLLDAERSLSVQVHPPARVAAALGGEPKNELWFIVDATEDAHLYAGLRAGVTRADFERRLRAGEDVSTQLQRIPVRTGDAIFIPSGRVHAIGGGCVIAEIQQNSDTTYRVFDFNRPGIDGRPRELHVEQSLASIDWDDVEPRLLPRRDGETLVSNEFFSVERWTLDGERFAAPPGECAIVCALGGAIECGGTSFDAGELFVVPSAPGAEPMHPAHDSADLLRIMLPEAQRDS